METIPLFKVHMPENVTLSLLKTLFSGFIGQGEKVEEFERALFPWLQSKNILSLNNGTSGLHLAMKLAGVQPGDEVISTPMTCMATNTPIVHAGAKIVWADIIPDTGEIDPASVENLITDKTRAIVCVHWGGYPCDLDVLNSFNIPVIEDAAHAFGATHKGQKIGSISDFTMFSFQAIKHITTIDGGLLTCKSKSDYERGKLLRWYGISREKNRELRCRDDVLEAGWKYHMSDISATIGLVQLGHVREILFKHWANANYYNIEFPKRKIKRVRPLSYKNNRCSAYWLYPVLVDDRASFIEFMKEKGVHTGQVHARNDTHTCFKDHSETRVELKGVKEFDDNQVSIPVGWWVTCPDRTKIMDAIEAFDKQ